jgi:DNA-directed RNA polymerase I, II, and III subunit RPABC2
MSDNDESDNYSDGDAESVISENVQNTEDNNKNVVGSEAVKAFDEEDDEAEDVVDADIDDVDDVDEMDNDDEMDDDEMDDESQAGGGDEENNSDDESKPLKTPQNKVIKSKNASNLVIEDDEDDDEDEYDDSYLQKFDSEITKNYVNEFHPECMIHNYDEIAKLTKVVRDSDNIIIDPLHKTIPFLTKYERARVLGQRAKQIETGARPLVKLPENIIDSYVIAELELQQKRIPFIIRRPIPNGGCEYWNIKDLEVILF